MISFLCFDLWNFFFQFLGIGVRIGTSNSGVARRSLEGPKILARREFIAGSFVRTSGSGDGQGFLLRHRRKQIRKNSEFDFLSSLRSVQFCALFIYIFLPSNKLFYLFIDR